LRYYIFDSHRHMSEKRLNQIKTFLKEVKNLDDDNADIQLDFIRWYETENAVKCFEAVAFDDNHVVGYMRCFRHREDPRKWFVGDVHVGKSHRGHGIATKLYGKVIEEVSQYENAEYILAYVDKSNDKSIGLHEKVGFYDTKSEIAFEPFQFSEGETTYKLWIINSMQVGDIELAKEVLSDIWTAYEKENGFFNSKDEADINLINALEETKIYEDAFFNILWCGNRMVGFETDEISYLDIDRQGDK